MPLKQFFRREIDSTKVFMLEKIFCINRKGLELNALGLLLFECKANTYDQGVKGGKKTFLPA